MNKINKRNSSGVEHIGILCASSGGSGVGGSFELDLKIIFTQMMRVVCIFSRRVECTAVWKSLWG